MTDAAASLGQIELDDLIPDSELRDADADAFRHRAIAERVAELASVTQTPCNIALYGPWGSGKSSFCHLLSVAVDRRSEHDRVIRYDAWKFGGQALKRNFITNAATQLGIDDNDRSRGRSQFHGGLHQSTSAVEFRPLEVIRNGSLWSLTVLVVAAAALALAVSLGWTGLEVWLTDAAFAESFKSILRPVGTAILSAAAAVAVALKVFEGANVTVERKAPSEDDEFDSLFRELVEKARQGKGVGRLIFFIDELDRCSKPDVVTTLASLRTFLDQPECVFIVAADREVLEEALSALEQETPIREDEPYYSSASAFLDKVFQYQFTLPPLRGGRLTGFARDLVIEKRGLWGQLREGENERRLNDVLYTLIPAHVRSPRRVKVLLNGYATNVRVAESRGVDWATRATELAKLTVLQVEFPAIAADLHLEPRLPSLLLNSPEILSDRQRLLLARHGPPSSAIGTDNTSEGAETTDEVSEVEPVSPDPLLAGRSSSTLRRRQHDDLMRYLESRAQVADDPGRDLLYLEVAGTSVGIDDPELGALIEDAGANSPGDVVEALADRSSEDRIAAAKALGQISENEFGRERENVITALAGALRDVDPLELIGKTGDLVAHVRSYVSEQSLTDEQFGGVFVLAVAAGSQGETLARHVLDNEEFLADGANVATAGRMLGHLDRQSASRVAIEIARLAADDPQLSVSVINNESHETAALFLDDAGIGFVEAFTAKETPAVATGTSAAAPAPAVELDAGPFTRLMLAAATESGTDLGDASARFAVLALDNLPGSYSVVHEYASVLVGNVDSVNEGNRLALTGIRRVVPSGWPMWRDHIVPTADDPGEAASTMVNVIRRAWKPAASTEQSRIDTARSEAPETLAAIAKLGPDLSESEDDICSPIEAELLLPLNSEDAAVRRSSLLSLVDVLGRLDAPEMRERLDDSVLASVEAALPPATVLDANTSGWLAEFISELPTDLLDSTHERFEAARTTELGVDPFYCRIQIALARRRLETTGERGVIPLEIFNTQVDQPFLAQSTIDWLHTGPSVADATVFLRSGHVPSEAVLVRAMSAWSSGLSVEERTSAFEELYSAGVSLRLATPLLGHDVDRPRLATFLAEQLDDASAQPARDRTVEAVKALQPTAIGETRPLVEAGLRMMATPAVKVKVGTAVQLLSLLGLDHRRKTAVEEKIRALHESGSLEAAPRRQLEQIGYRVPKKKRKGPFGIFR